MCSDGDGSARLVSSTEPRRDNLEEMPEEDRTAETRQKKGRVNAVDGERTGRQASRHEGFRFGLGAPLRNIR